MPHVVTQSCVGDGSCVYACPVNCIQPTPDDPAFELAEMLHVDPKSCVDCGACLSACPVDAIKPHTQLNEDERVFAEINAAFHQQPRRQSLLAPIRPPLVFRDRGEPLRVAIVGSGPAAMYAAEEVLTIPGARVSVYERGERLGGLVKDGVAPDHRRTRRVGRQLERIAGHERLRMHFGVEVGSGVTHADLRDSHHAVIYAIGATDDRALAVPGGEHAVPSTQVVGWYTGALAATIDLSARRAVVIGAGNVALDIARILTQDPDSLADSEIAPEALEALRSSRIEEVVVAARRGAADASFSLPELVGLTGTVPVGVDAAGGLEGDGPKLELLRSLDEPRAAGRRVTLRFDSAPALLGPDRIAFADGRSLDAGLIISAIGFRGRPAPDLPFDEATGTVPNEDGRVEPGVYVAGWIKRGPSGGIGTNKACSQDTVAALVDDHNAGRLGRPLQRLTA